MLFQSSLDKKFLLISISSYQRWLKICHPLLCHVLLSFSTFQVFLKKQQNDEPQIYVLHAGQENGVQAPADSLLKLEDLQDTDLQ